MGTVSHSARCSGCGQALPVGHVGPCPACGDLKKTYEVRVQDEVKVRDSFCWQHVHEYYEKHKVLLSLVIVITIGAPFLGLILDGWVGVGLGVIIGVATFLLGLRAVTKGREIREGH